MRNLFTLLVLSITISSSITAQIQQFISSNDFPAVETNEAKICLGSDASLTIVDSETEDFDWTWYGPNGIFAEGKNLYLSSVAAHQLGIYEAVSNQGDFYHFELKEQNENFVNWKNDKMIVAGSQAKIKSPVIKEGYTYQWSNGAYGPEINVSLIQTTTYAITVTTEFGCVDSDEITVHVAKTPQHLKNRNLRVCKEGNYFLDGPRDFVTYEWLSFEANTEDVIIKPIKYGSVCLKATDAKGENYYYRYKLTKFDCEASNDKSSVGVDPMISDELNRLEDEFLSQAEDTENEEEIVTAKRNLEIEDGTIQYQEIPTRMYPNPATDFITIELDNFEALGDVSFTILDNSQNKVQQQSRVSNGQRIDLRSFNSGIYYLVVRSNSGRSVQQFIIAR